ncbi:MAG: B12-binding domain-containing radical SAM protein [Patescibacteria group bacterium]|nr:B12-binding domain-containing radical SAM protein [Patescibacteria group bacterium]
MSLEREGGRTLLINPPYTDYFDSDHFKLSRPDRNLSGVNLPLGIGYIASFLQERGIEVDGLDMEVTQSSLSEIADRVNREGIRFVGITSVSSIIDKAIRIGTYLKRNTDAYVVLGGVHATAEPQETASLESFDAVAVGEGELTMLDLVTGLPPEQVRGLLYRKSGDVKINPPQPIIEDLDSLPPPAINLFPFDQYRPSLHRDLDPSIDQPYYTVISSRGCPYSCRFCYSKGVFSYRVRDRSIGNVVDEIESFARERGRTKVMFYDDTFSYDRARTLEFCNEVGQRNLDIVWGCNTRVDRVTPEILAEMRKRGLKRVYVGVESGNDAILKQMMKGLTKDKVRKGLAIMADSGVEVSASYIIGVPGETRKTIEETIAFAIENNTDYAHFYTFTPDPGSPYYVDLKSRGIIKPYDWLSYGQMIRKGTEALGERIDWAELLEYTREAYKRYYSRPEYRRMRERKLKTPLEHYQMELLINEYSGNL